MLSTQSILHDATFKGVREVKSRLSHYLRNKKPTCITEHGEPKSILLPYKTLVKLAKEAERVSKRIEEYKDILAELENEALLKRIEQGRKDYEKGSFIPGEGVFRRLGLL